MAPLSCRASVWVMVAGCVGGCDGGAGPTRDGAVPPEDAALGEAAADAGARDAAEDGGAPTRPAPTGSPLPPGVAPPRRLFGGEAALTGDGSSRCSRGGSPAGSGDRWCVFMVPDPAGTGGALWVMNVTRAAAGEVPRCDGTSPGCLRLTTRLWMGGGLIGPVHPYAHEFHGDTLVFYADAVSAPARTHRGPVYAWRPGWAQPRRISSDRALVCWVHDRGGAVLAHCLEDLFGDPTNAAVSPPSFELRAGPIADADGMVLPSLGRIRANRSDGLPAWQTGFSPDGQVFAFSSADPDPAVETLRVVPTAELGRAAPRELARDAGRWEISRDGRRVYFLRQEAPTADALYVADFPSGANPTRLDPRVADFIFPGDEGAAAVGFTSNLSQPGQSRGAFRLLRAPGAGVITVFAFEGVLESVRVSRDLRFTAWADEDFHARVVRHADLASCELNADRSRPAYGPTFLAGGGLVFWAEDAGGDREHRDGYLADPDGCRGKRRFAQSLQFVAPVGDRGVVFADEVDDDTQRSNLKYAAIGAGSTWPAEGAIRIHDDIDGSSVSAASLEPLLLLFRVSPGGPAKEGTYLFGPVPF